MEPIYATVRKRRRSPPEGQSHSPPLSMSAHHMHKQSAREDTALEARYGGREEANRAAAVIQRAYRAARLQRQFSRLLVLAMSTERLNKR